MNKSSSEKIDAFFGDSEKVTRAMGEAVRKTLRMHKLLGYPIVVWRDGKVVHVPPEEIELPEAENGQSSAK